VIYIFLRSLEEEIVTKRLARPAQPKTKFLFSIDGKTKVPLVEQPANDYFLGWTPNGKYLLFASDRTGTFDAWILPVSDGRPNGEPEIVWKNLGYVHPMGVTRTETSITAFIAAFRIFTSPL
jgi:hypothetical protein